MARENVYTFPNANPMAKTEVIYDGFDPQVASARYRQFAKRVLANPDMQMGVRWTTDAHPQASTFHAIDITSEWVANCKYCPWRAAGATTREQLDEQFIGHMKRAKRQILEDQATNEEEG